MALLSFSFEKVMKTSETEVRRKNDEKVTSSSMSKRRGNFRAVHRNTSKRFKTVRTLIVYLQLRRSLSSDTPIQHACNKPEYPARVPLPAARNKLISFSKRLASVSSAEHHLPHVIS